MKVRDSCLARPVTTTLFAGLLCWLPTSNQYAQVVSTNVFVTFGPAYRGNAAAALGFAGRSAVSIADAALLSETGGVREAAALDSTVAGGLSIGESHAAVVGQGTETASEASAANISYTNASSFFGPGINVTADFVMSRADAACSTNGPAVSGQSEVDGLVINGKSIAVTGETNQTVMLNGGNFVIINEQLSGETDIAVNALHIVALGSGASVVIGSSTAGFTCGGETNQPPTCGDFVTGGGWITRLPSGAKADFGVAGGKIDGTLWGHLNYIDNGSGLHVEQTAVAGYQVDSNDPDCRIIDYTVTINGQPGTAQVLVCDKGELGRNDEFEIQLSTGYFAAGDLGGTKSGGGNIQVHHCQ